MHKRIFIPVILLWGIYPCFCFAQERVTFPMGFEGYCPVAAFEAEADGDDKTSPFVPSNKGKSEFAFLFDETVYFFASLENKEKFVDDPITFAPAYRGICVPCLKYNNLRILGNTRFYIFYADRFFLFTNEKKKNEFELNKASFQNFDLAKNGVCVVTGQTPKKETEFRTMYKGKVYLFGSLQDLKKFESEPSRYAEK